MGFWANILHLSNNILYIFCGNEYLIGWSIQRARWGLRPAVLVRCSSQGYSVHLPSLFLQQTSFGSSPFQSERPFYTCCCLGQRAGSGRPTTSGTGESDSHSSGLVCSFKSCERKASFFTSNALEYAKQLSNIKDKKYRWVTRNPKEQNRVKDPIIQILIQVYRIAL